jgi:hypothetical protein
MHVEYMINDRLSFMRFLGIEIGNKVRSCCNQFIFKFQPIYNVSFSIFLLPMFDSMNQTAQKSKNNILNTTDNVRPFPIAVCSGLGEFYRSFCVI